MVVNKAQIFNPSLLGGYRKFSPFLDEDERSEVDERAVKEQAKQLVQMLREQARSLNSPIVLPGPQGPQGPQGAGPVSSPFAASQPPLTELAGEPPPQFPPLSEVLGDNEGTGSALGALASVPFRGDDGEELGMKQFLAEMDPNNRLDLPGRLRAVLRNRAADELTDGGGPVGDVLSALRVAKKPIRQADRKLKKEKLLGDEVDSVVAETLSDNFSEGIFAGETGSILLEKLYEKERQEQFREDREPLVKAREDLNVQGQEEIQKIHDDSARLAERLERQAVLTETDPDNTGFTLSAIAHILTGENTFDEVSRELSKQSQPVLDEDGNPVIDEETGLVAEPPFSEEQIKLVISTIEDTLDIDPETGEPAKFSLSLLPPDLLFRIEDAYIEHDDSAGFYKERKLYEQMVARGDNPEDQIELFPEMQSRGVFDRDEEEGS
jgi:hypothetical protein